MTEEYQIFSHTAKRRVFLSYSHEDKAEALHISSIIDILEYTPPHTTRDDAIAAIPFVGLAWTVADLLGIRPTTFELKTWMDQQIAAGTNWTTAIQSAINSSLFFVVLIPSAPSTQVAHECGIARALNKVVIPITQDATHLGNYNLSQTQALGWPTHNSEWVTNFISAMRTATKLPIELQARYKNTSYEAWGLGSS